MLSHAYCGTSLTCKTLKACDITSAVLTNLHQAAPRISNLPTDIPLPSKIRLSPGHLRTEGLTCSTRIRRPRERCFHNRAYNCWGTSNTIDDPRETQLAQRNPKSFLLRSWQCRPSNWSLGRRSLCHHQAVNSQNSSTLTNQLPSLAMWDSRTGATLQNLRPAASLFLPTLTIAR